MGLETKLDSVSPEIRKLYRQHKAQIEAYRKAGHALREEVKQDPVRSGHLLTRDLHDVEYKVVAELCPEIRAKDAKQKLKAWYWVLRQDWGKDLRASPYERRYYGGSAVT